MLSAPGSELLPAHERQRFLAHFEKDITFFQLFFLLFNRSCPIQNIDLVWKEQEGPGRAALRHLGTTQALEGPCSRLLKYRITNPHPAFCNIINDYGRHESESCGISDKAAEERVDVSGASEVYRCHFGLVDIAVPVIWNDVHVATLYTGQVLTASAAKEGFAGCATAASALPYVDLANLERAYAEVPVVSDEDIENTVAILETFAEYLANSWTRLADTVDEEQRREREMQLLRKEFAYLALEGKPADRPALQEFMEKLGLAKYPNRVLVVKPEPQQDHASFDLGLTTAIQAVEELCQKDQNATAAYLRNRGICVFFHDGALGNERAGEFHAHRLARKVLQAVRQRADIYVRIGLGSAKTDWCSLAESYREAWSALAASSEVIAAYRKPSDSLEELSSYAERVAGAVSERRFDAARNGISALLCRAQSRLGGNLAAQRVYFSSALESMLFAAQELGMEPAATGAFRNEASNRLAAPSDETELQNVYLALANQFVAEIAALFTGRRTKMIERACRIVERGLERPPGSQPLTINAVASALNISVSHFSRLFRQATGETFEHFLIRKRIELAQRLLLEPQVTIAQVAERCDFNDPNYFARAFRKLTGCSPREYRENPLRAFTCAVKVPKKTDMCI